MPDVEGSAIVYCQGAFATTNGKTAHGLVRRSERYRVLSVIDSECAGREAGHVLDGRPAGIPIYASMKDALSAAREQGDTPTHLVMGLAPEGGRLPKEARNDVLEALHLGLNVDSGLHDFLSEDEEFIEAARVGGATIRDIRKPPPRNQLHFFSGAIAEVTALTIALLGTDSAVGKRTTAWLLVDGLRRAGLTAHLVGTGQTAWLQGARYGVILDSLINDFVAGEIEHAVCTCFDENHPDVIVIEGQGSLMNPAYPGGFEILAAARPSAVFLQHAPARRDYDGFPGFPIHPLERQIQVIELASPCPVVAITVNHEAIEPEAVPSLCGDLSRQTGRPVCDVLLQGTDRLVDVVQNLMRG